MEMYKCTYCQVEKSKELFLHSKSGYRVTICKECRSSYQKQWREENKESLAETRAKYREENKEEINYRQRELYALNREDRTAKDRAYRALNREETNRKSRLRYRNYCKKRVQPYGLTVEELEVMLKAQENKCAICECVPNQGKVLHIDHNHTTGKVRQLLCQACNQRVGHMEHGLALKTLEYLLHHDDNK